MFHLAKFKYPLMTQVCSFVLTHYFLQAQAGNLTRIK